MAVEEWGQWFLFERGGGGGETSRLGTEAGAGTTSTPSVCGEIREEKNGGEQLCATSGYEVPLSLQQPLVRVACPFVCLLCLS